MDLLEGKVGAFLVTENTTITYEETMGLIRVTKSQLCTLFRTDIDKEEIVVCTIMPNSVEQIVLFLSLLSMPRVILHPMHPETTQAELEKLPFNCDYIFTLDAAFASDKRSVAVKNGSMELTCNGQKVEPSLLEIDKDTSRTALYLMTSGSTGKSKGKLRAESK